MGLLIITADGIIALRHISLTVIGKVGIGTWIFPHIFQERHDLECGSRRVKSLGHTVIEDAAALGRALRCQRVPFLIDSARVVVGLGHHSQYPSRGSLQHHHRTLVLAQSVVGKQVRVRVFPGLRAVGRHLGFCQHRAVRGQDIAPDIPLCKSVQSGIIRIIDYLRA